MKIIIYKRLLYFTRFTYRVIVTLQGTYANSQHPLNNNLIHYNKSNHLTPIQMPHFKTHHLPHILLTNKLTPYPHTKLC